MARVLRYISGLSLSGSPMVAARVAAAQDYAAFASTAPSGGPGSSQVHFSDVLSTLNPLQYLPVVGTIYRTITGDSVHPAFRVAASAALSLVFGGPIGLAATMIGVAAEEIARGGPTTLESGQRSALAARAYGQIGRAA
jgi:hypothetical protein